MFRSRPWICGDFYVRHLSCLFLLHQNHQIWQNCEKRYGNYCPFFQLCCSGFQIQPLKNHYYCRRFPRSYLACDNNILFLFSCRICDVHILVLFLLACVYIFGFFSKIFRLETLYNVSLANNKCIIGQTNIIDPTNKFYNL